MHVSTAPQRAAVWRLPAHRLVNSAKRKGMERYMTPLEVVPMTPLQRPVAGIVFLEDAVTHGEACVCEQNCSQDVGFSLPQIGSCNIAEPTRTQALFLFDSHCLE